MRVDLVDHNASDLKCVNAARVSYSTHHDELTEGDRKLINAMLREHHGSVFEHASFTFRITAPIAVVRQWMRHRIGHSYNEQSGRYVKMQDEFYIPRPRGQVGKAMAYKYTNVDVHVEELVRKHIEVAYRVAYDKYQELLDWGVAKEVARYVLPLGLMTHWYWSCNARSMMHFLNLRTADQAGEEIRELAEQAEEYFANIMPITHKAFCDNGRVAP